MTPAMHIEVDDLSRHEVQQLLTEHLDNMYALSPAESVHALDLGKLRAPDITFWTAWDGQTLLGCGALKQLDAEHGEIKSMRTAYAFQRQGVASYMLRFIIEEARRRGYRRLSLETGAMDYFEPARKLYAGFGFQNCAPFGAYKLDPNSAFMTLEL